MSRYIDADKLKLSLLTLQNTLKACGFINGVGWVQVLIDAVDVTQAVDVAEVKHGKWEVVSRGLTLNNVEGALPLSYQLRQCSECEYVTVAARSETHKWCPHCGAKMDLEEAQK